MASELVAEASFVANAHVELAVKVVFPMDYVRMRAISGLIPRVALISTKGATYIRNTELTLIATTCS